MKAFLLATALLSTPALAAERYDLTTVDIIDARELGPYTTYFLDPVTRPCWTDPAAWAADLESRGYGEANLGEVTEGVNSATGEAVAMILAVDEPDGGEAWAMVKGEPGKMCLHFVTYLTEPNL